MIKIFASDLDGTLLPPDKVMPKETFPLIEKIRDKNALFVPASGRQLPNLKKLFSPVLGKIAIIAENGGLVWYGGKIIFSDPTPSADALRALDIVRGIDGLYPVVCLAERAYYEDGYPKFVQTLKRSYSSETRVDNLNEIVKNDDVIKISVWDDKPAVEHGGVILPPLICGLRTRVSGYDWLDISTPHADKGKALNALMELLNVKKEECAAFGDHLNDYEMLCASGHPFVTANAYPPLKELIGEEIASNANFGVIEKIKEILNNQGL